MEEDKLKEKNLSETAYLESGITEVKEFQTPEELYNTLISMVKRYHPSDDVSMIEKAYLLARDAHAGQKRKSGEDYINHPLSVAIILADLEMDKETIVAGILHDVVEDTVFTEEDMIREFGDEVALIVSGVTKIGQLSYTKDKLESQAETYRKMFLAMSQDIRVVIVKLADRLHNMRTAKYWSPAKQVEKARETLDIYAPLASRLGISKIKVELDDLSLKYLEPQAYYDLVEKVSMKKTERQAFIDGIIRDVSEAVERFGIKAEIKGRYKHFFSIYKKMVKQNKTLDQVYDMFAIRIIVETIPDCYTVLGLINSMYMMMPGRFKDYISVKKKNGYQSLHNTMIAKDGQPFEVQIRTYEMHRTAEYGIAAHWKYKELSQKGKNGKARAAEAQAEWGNKTTAQQQQEKLTWLSEILELQRESDNKEYVNLLKGDLNLFQEDVYCFSPKGRVISLPAGSTCIDFAYAIHTEVGNKMVGARINDRLVPIETEVKSGDRIEVMTSSNTSGPKYEWLKHTKSSQAKNKINQWFRQQNKADNIVRGREKMASFAREKNRNLDDLLLEEYKDQIVKKYTLRNWDALLAAVGHGGLKEGQVVNKLIELYDKDHKAQMTNEEVLKSLQGEASETKRKPSLQSFHGISIHYGKCCSPVPGDEIIGYTTRGRGLTVHRTDCVNIMAMSSTDRQRLFPVEWPEDSSQKGEQYEVMLRLMASDRRGLMADVSGVIADNKINISSINSNQADKKGNITMLLGIYVHSKEDLNSIVAKLMKVPSVFEVTRTNI